MFFLAKDEIELDTNTVEYLFASKPATMKPPKENQPEKKQLVSILDSKRANHVGISTLPPIIINKTKVLDLEN